MSQDGQQGDQPGVGPQADAPQDGAQWAEPRGQQTDAPQDRAQWSAGQAGQQAPTPQDGQQWSPPARALGPTPPRPLPSRTGAIGMLTGGGLLLVLAALCAFLLPNIFVFNALETSMPVDGEYYYDYVQSGQPTDIPAEQYVYIQPDWVWMDPAMNPADGSEPVMPEFTCTVTTADGVQLPTGWEDWMGVTVEVVEAGTHVIECEGGGMLNMNGTPLSETQQGESMNRTLAILNWTSWISLAAGIALSLLGAYLLGTRNQQRKYALDAVYASVPMGGGQQPSYQGAQPQSGYPGAPQTDPNVGTRFYPNQGAQYFPQGGPQQGGPQQGAATPGAQIPGAPMQAPSQYDPALNPHIPRNSDSYQVRPRTTRKSKDPFAE
nr:hypothetical protein [Actinomycetales bacterium]